MFGSSGDRIVMRFVAAALLLALGTATPATADPVTDFFRGKTINLLIGYTSGGGYDLNAPVLAKHMGRHIPANPTVRPKTLPGAGSLRAANFLYRVAPKAGTSFGMLGRGRGGAPLMGATRVQSDSRRFTWLGSVSDQVSLCATWHTSPVK